MTFENTKKKLYHRIIFNFFFYETSFRFFFYRLDMMLYIRIIIYLISGVRKDRPKKYSDPRNSVPQCIANKIQKISTAPVDFYFKIYVRLWVP